MYALECARCHNSQKDLQHSHSLSQSNEGGRQWTNKTNILNLERSCKCEGNEEGNVGK